MKFQSLRSINSSTRLPPAAFTRLGTYRGMGITTETWPNPFGLGCYYSKRLKYVDSRWGVIANPALAG